MGYAFTYATIKDGKLFVSAPTNMDGPLRSHNARRLKNGSYIMNCSPNNILFLTRNEVRWEHEHAAREAKRILDDLEEYRKAVSLVPEVIKGSLEFFGDYQPKLPLYKHQITAVNLMVLLKHMGLFMDCGTGKTGTSLVYIELMQRLLQRPLKALVVGKLMTLFSGWAEDCEKFTDLKCEVLWEPTKSITNITSDEPSEEYDRAFLGGRYKLVPKTKGMKISSRSAIIYTCKKSGSTLYIGSSKNYDPKKHNRCKYIWKEIPAEDPSVRQVVEGSFKKQTYETCNLKRQSLSERIATSDATVHIINHDGARIFQEDLAKVSYDIVIIDESTVIKNPQSELLKSMKAIAHASRYRFCLTGTPASNGPQNLWAQLYWLDRGVTLGDHYQGFLERHFKAERQHFGHVNSPNHKEFTKYTPTEETLAWVRSRLENRHYRVELRDCVDMPELTSQVIDVFLTDKQSQAYSQMSEILYTEIDGVTIEANIALTKLMKLRQITGGFVLKTGCDTTVAFDQNPKLETLQELVDPLLEQGEQVVIFATFKEEIEAIQRLYPESITIYGRTKEQDRFEGVDAFKAGKTKVVICQPQSAAHGLTFVNSRYLIFYSEDFSAEHNYQAIKRIERIGQKRAMFVYYLIAKTSTFRETIDNVVYKSLHLKQKHQSYLIDGLSQAENAKAIVNNFLQSMKENSQENLGIST